MDILVRNTKSLRGSITPPASKSHSIRALLLSAVTDGISHITNALDSVDTRACIRVCRDIGATVSSQKTKDGGLAVEVMGCGPSLRINTKSLSTGESGITTRFLLPLLGLRAHSSFPVTLQCGAQMRQRPILPLVAALNNLGMDIQLRSAARPWPLTVSGSLLGGTTLVDGTTSQYLSALLFSLPLASRDSLITVPNLNERPYVEMTTRWLDELGIAYIWRKKGHNDMFRIKGNQAYRPFKKTIPADFSSASYFLAAAVLCRGEMEITNLDFSDAQGDKALVPILQKMGARIKKKKHSIAISGGKPLKGIRIDCNKIPDLVPTLAVLGAQARGSTDLYNVAHARLKETDRLAAMARELTKMDARIKETRDGLIIEQSELRGATVNGHGDHRTIMALAIAGLCASGQTRIRGAQGIAKTFPSFPKLLRSIGGNLKIII